MSNEAVILNYREKLRTISYNKGTNNFVLPAPKTVGNAVHNNAVRVSFKTKGEFKYYEDACSYRNVCAYADIRYSENREAEEEEMLPAGPLSDDEKKLIGPIGQPLEEKDKDFSVAHKCLTLKHQMLIRSKPVKNTPYLFRGVARNVDRPTNGKCIQIKLLAVDRLPYNTYSSQKHLTHVDNTVEGVIEGLKRQDREYLTLRRSLAFCSPAFVASLTEKRKKEYKDQVMPLNFPAVIYTDESVAENVELFGPEGFRFSIAERASVYMRECPYASSRLCFLTLPRANGGAIAKYLSKLDADEAAKFRPPGITDVEWSMVMQTEWSATMAELDKKGVVRDEEDEYDEDDDEEEEEDEDEDEEDDDDEEELPAVKRQRRR